MVFDDLYYFHLARSIPTFIHSRVDISLAVMLATQPSRPIGKIPTYDGLCVFCCLIKLLIIVIL